MTDNSFTWPTMNNLSSASSFIYFAMTSTSTPEESRAATGNDLRTWKVKRVVVTFASRPPLFTWPSFVTLARHTGAGKLITPGSLLLASIIYLYELTNRIEFGFAGKCLTAWLVRGHGDRDSLSTNWGDPVGVMAPTPRAATIDVHPTTVKGQRWWWWWWFTQSHTYIFAVANTERLWQKSKRQTGQHTHVWREKQQKRQTDRQSRFDFFFSIMNIIEIFQETVFISWRSSTVWTFQTTYILSRRDGFSSVSSRLKH